MTGDLPLPERIGPFRILQLLGEGGMGQVYEAEDTGPVRRRVALKVVRAGIQSQEILARFEAERQALAVMNHPGIARVLHAGTTERGEPYFAMELVRGPPITEYCDAHRLSVRERLGLFVAVCQAVQHAHQKGVIHRDLKPTNILVIDQDDVPQPKIIDFGIAKALGLQLTANALVTLGGQVMGTAAYMSPEQADAAGVDVDTRADLYSLGVILYEVLVGQLPLEPDAIGVHVFLARLAARETHPPTPSVKLMAGRARAASVAQTRRTDLQHLRRDLRGDLDWIVMKAMDPDRSRRYESAAGLANDLRRYLAQEPVLARPPSARYRVSKFVQRHRLGVAAAGIVALAVVAGAVLSTIGFVRASRAERLAAAEAAAANEVTRFLVDLFRISDPDQARGSTLTARELLDRGALDVRTSLAGQPVLQSRILLTLGTVYQRLGLYDPARALLQDALAIRRAPAGEADEAAVAEVLKALGDVAAEKGEFAQADTAYHAALAIRRRLHGAEHADVATTLSAMAAMRLSQGKAAEAESLLVEVVSLNARVRSPDDPRALSDQSNLAVAYYFQGRLAAAESLFRKTLEIQRRALGPDHPDVTGALMNLGAVYWAEEKYGEALANYEQVRPVFERTFGPNHPQVAGIYNNLAETFWKLRRYREGEELFRRALGIKESVFDPGHTSIAETLHGLASLLHEQGRNAEAEPLYRRALAIRQRALGPDDPRTRETRAAYDTLARLTAARRPSSPLTRDTAAPSAPGRPAPGPPAPAPR
jgi:non-specific serine/threonine protein kinase/serine/threonine-protein kinase